MATGISFNVGGGSADSEFTVRCGPHGWAIFGNLPVSEFVRIAKCFGSGAVMALGVASALDAITAICDTQEQADKWRQEINAAAGDDWLKTCDTGASSLTIYSVLHPSVLNGSQRIKYRLLGWLGSVPSDPGDFGRCHGLLERYPEWRGRLGEVVAKYPAWEKLAAEWPRLTALYVRDLPTGRSAELYEEMRKLEGGNS